VWDAEHVSPALPPLVDHAEVVRRINAVVSTSPDLFSSEKIGESMEGRSIHHVRVGTGPFRVLLWSQMHGDEPTATSALFDLFEYVRLHRDEPVVRRILSSLTLHAVPMLNPDGAQRFERRNRQSIDVNRDALRLQTPEGQILKTLRDRLEPGSDSICTIRAGGRRSVTRRGPHPFRCLRSPSTRGAPRMPPGN